MFLTFRNITHYLLDQGLITQKDIFNNNLIITPLESRNNSFTIQREGETDFFLKQVKALDQERTATLKTEADCYWLAENHSNFSKLAEHIPTYVNYDYTNHILVTECLTNTVNLSQFYMEEKKMPIEVAAQQADTLAACHKQTRATDLEENVRRLFPNYRPSVFALNEQNLAYWSEKDKAAEQMVKLIRGNKKFLELLQNAGQDWQSSTLIHGDVKHANYLIKKEENSYQTYLIDWEIASFGDPCWDVAGVLQNYLLYWIDNETSNHSYQGFDLESLKPSLQSFWQNYSQQMNFTQMEADAALEKSLRFSGLKLIQTCRESLREQQQMPTSSAMMLQLSLNILSNPKQSSEQLILN